MNDAAELLIVEASRCREPLSFSPHLDPAVWDRLARLARARVPQDSLLSVQPRVDPLCRVATYGTDREIGLHRDVGSRRQRLPSGWDPALVPSLCQVVV
jgi:hypothetical protein